MALTEYGSSTTPTQIVSDGAGGIWSVAVGTGSPNCYVQKHNAALSSRSDYSIGATFDAASSYGGCLGPDGNLWFTDYANNVLLKVTTAGSITRYTTGFSGKGLCGICTDGTDLFIACLTTDQILKVSTAGTVSSTFSMTAGKGVFQVCHTGGNLYFTCNTTSQIGKCTTAGASISYTATKTASAGPYGICVGPDGLIWYVEEASGVRKIAKISTDMSTTHLDYATGVTSTDPRFICSDGTDLWFSDYGGNRVCRITTSGTVTQYTPTASSSPYGITYYSGKVYFTEYARANVGSFDTPVALSRTTSDSWGWTDTTTGVAGKARTTGDSWAWSDAAAGKITARVTSESWAWSDSTPVHLYRPGPAASPPTPGSRTTIVDDTKYNAFPGFCVAANGDLLACWTQGTSHDSSDQVVKMARSTDNGASWGTPVTISSGTYRQKHGALTVLSDGSIIVTYLEINAATSIQRCWSRRSTDHGATWGTPKRIPTFGNYWTGDGNMGGAITSPCVELPGSPGTLVVALHAINAGQDPTYCYIHTSTSTDYGETWTTGSAVFSYDGATDGFEPYLLNVKLANGTYKLTCLIRSELYYGGVTKYVLRKADSTNGGTTWGPVTSVKTGLESNTRPSAFQHPDGGVIVAVREPLVSTPFAALVSGYIYSTDYCESFGSTTTLDATGGEVYSQWAPISRNTIGIVYALDMGTPNLPAPQVTNTDANVYYRTVTFSTFDDQWAWSDGASRQRTFNRAASDSWAWSDGAAATSTRSRSTADSWAWTDSSTGVKSRVRTTTDSWAWTDTNTRSVTHAYARNTFTDTWAWTDSATRTTSTTRTRSTADTWSWTDSAGAPSGAATYVRPFTTTLTIQSVTAPLDVHAVTAPLDLTTEAP